MTDLFPVIELQPLVGLAGWDADLASASRDVATGVCLGFMRLPAVPSPVPLSLTVVGKRIAARFYENPTDLRSLSVAGIAETFSPLLDDYDKLILSVVASQAGSGRALSVQLGY